MSSALVLGETWNTTEHPLSLMQNFNASLNVGPKSPPPTDSSEARDQNLLKRQGLVFMACCQEMQIADLMNDKLALKKRGPF